MKKNFYLSLLVLAAMVFTVSCSDDDEPGGTDPVVNPEVSKVLQTLGEIEGVADFTKVLSDNALGLEVGEDNITVFAVKDQSSEEAKSDDETISKDNLKRHIVSGVYDLTDFALDSLVVVSLSGDPIAITKTDDGIFVNGALLEKTDASEAGDNLIYVVDKVVPDVEITEQSALFTVYEINEAWEDGADEKALSDTATIEIFRSVDGEYVKIASVLTTEGLAEFKHFYVDALFYTVKKDMHSFR